MLGFRPNPLYRQAEFEFRAKSKLPRALYARVSQIPAESDPANLIPSQIAHVRHGLVHESQEGEPRNRKAARNLSNPARNLGKLYSRILLEDSGQDLIEYALIAALIALGAIAAMGSLSNKIGSEFNKIGSSL